MNRGRTTNGLAQAVAIAIALLMPGAFHWPVSLRAQDQSAQVVEVIVDRSVSIPLASVSHFLVIDESVCRVEIRGGALQLFGLKRGETIVVAWINDRPESLLVHVVAAPAPTVERALTTEELDAIGHGTVGALAHVGTTTRGGRSVSFLTPFSWTEGTSNRRFAMNGQLQGTHSEETSDVNLDTVSAQWTRGTATLTLLDFVTDLDGGPAARITPSGRVGGFTLRGGNLAFIRGRNAYELFGGTTVPWFEASRQLVGLNVKHQENARVYIDATSGVISAPVLAGGTAIARDVNAFQTVGITERWSERVSGQVRGGVGTSGFYGQAASSWQGERFSAFVAGAGSSPRFGLNQLQLVYAPTVDVQSGATWNVSRFLRTGVGYTHTATEATPLFPASSSSDSVSSTISLALTRHHTVFANGVWNANTGGLGGTGRLTGRRFDTGISSQVASKVSNNFQLSTGALADPLQLASRSEFSVRDSVSVVTGRGSLSVSFSHDRLSPSLVARLREQLNLIAPSLQPLFLDDPVAFIQSPQMPAEVRQILESLEPIDTQVVVAGQINAGRRLAISPTVSYLHNAQSRSLLTKNTMVGYALTWRATSSMEIVSSLSNALIFDPRQSDLARTTIVGIGARKTLHGAPRWVVPSAGYRIRGRVFRDTNLDGVGGPAESGLAGVRVDLDGRRAAHTDEHGRFEFDGLSAGAYRLVMSLEQFGRGIRVTTPIDREIRLYSSRVADFDFGVVNFSRLMGSVFNDSALDGVRQGDAPGVRAVGVVIEGNGVERHVATDAAGEFEVDDLAPGEYRLSIDGDTLPENFSPPPAAVRVDVAPSATAQIAIPLRALRSIEGQVFFRTPADRAGAPGALKVLKGVKVAAGHSIAITDEEGRFVLRDLPAGALAVNLEPIRPMPDDLPAPAGRVQLPTDPVHIRNASIVIDNPRLLDYLVDRTD